jgi:ABC-type nitrate/sulfonate/bicarbonate transport system substrate-binding protein
MRTLVAWIKRCSAAPVGIAALLGVLAAPAGAQTLKPFKFGISAPVVTVFPAFMADAQKLYEKHGLKVDIVSMEGGSRGIQVLLSGEIQGMSVGLAPVVQANVRGADVRTLVTTSNTIPITFFAQSKFKGPQDLKGANFGISTFGSETDIAVSLALKKWGMSRNDIVISQVGGTTQRYTALVAGRIDVAPLLEPGITQARQKGGFNMVLDLAAENTPWIFDSVVVTKASITANADGIERFLKAYIEAAYMALAEPAKAKEAISARWKTKDPVVIDATYNDFKRLMPLDAKPSLAGGRNVIEQLEAIGTKVPDKNIASYVDLGPLERLEKSGWIAATQKQYGLK